MPGDLCFAYANEVLFIAAAGTEAALLLATSCLSAQAEVIAAARVPGDG